MRSETFYFQITLASPVHIGSGEVYEPMSFVIDKSNKELISFNPGDFLALLSSDELKDYSRICSKGNIASIKDLYLFMQRHSHIIITNDIGCRVDISDDFLLHYENVLKRPRDRFQRELQEFKIDRTCFNPINNETYIPGSSVKGAIKTSVLNYRNNDKTYPTYNGKRANNNLQKDLLGGEFDTDPFSLIKVSDFIPVSNIKRKINYAVSFAKKDGARKLSVMQEVIETGSSFIGSITVLPTRTQISKPINIHEISTALQKFYSTEKQREDLELTSVNIRPTPLDMNKSTTLRIGKHSGAECITVRGQRKIKISAPGTKPIKTSKPDGGATTVWLASSKKSPRNKSGLMAMGWVELSLLNKEKYKELLTQHQNFQQKHKDLYEQSLKRQEEIKQKYILKERKLKETIILKQQEKQKREQELKEYPWREVLPISKEITDWGSLKTKIFDNKIFIKYQSELEIGNAVKTLSIQIAKNNLKKWDDNRDQIVAEWLKQAEISWHPLATSSDLDTDPLLVVIKKWQTPADYDRSLQLSDLSLECCQALQQLFKKWKWHNKKAKKNNQQLWKKLMGQIKKLKN